MITTTDKDKTCWGTTIPIKQVLIIDSFTGLLHLPVQVNLPVRFLVHVERESSILNTKGSLFLVMAWEIQMRMLIFPGQCQSEIRKEKEKGFHVLLKQDLNLVSG